jgi:CheY-like chemotaxis protein
MTIEPQSGDHKILVVDDHSISGRFAMAALRQSSGSIKWARTASEALAMALAWYPDLICMDLNLPDIGGLEVIRRIRLEWPADRPQPRIIVLTGDDSGSSQSDLTDLNVDRLLVKPVSRHQLREAARLQADNHIKEAGPDEHRLELENLFRQELEQRLPELDRCISNFDHDEAVAILHQLIASSAICSEHRFESALRALGVSCRRQDSTAELAQSYYAVLELAQEYLHRPGSVTLPAAS